MTTVKNIYDFINSIAPFNTQDDWDNSGHLIGDFRKEVKKVVLSLDGTKTVADFAAEQKADLFLTHHPIIFGGIASVKSDTAVYKLVSSNISVICAHTNYDKSNRGINQNLATILELKNIEHQEDGYTVIGELENEMSMEDFAKFVNDKLNCSGLRYVNTKKTIKTVSLCGGAGSEFMNDMASKSDCFVTGDLKYHDMLDASEMGFAVISAGHFETENDAFLMLVKELEKIFTDVEFIIAPRENPIMAV